MASISTNVDLGRVSAVVGYGIEATLEGIGLGFLPQSIGIPAQADTVNESTAPSVLSFTSSKEVGDEFGYGSQAYQIARILRPKSGDVLGGIPTKILKVAAAGGGAAKVITTTVSGTATGNATHYLKVNGRTQLDGDSYAFSVETGDTASEVATKMASAMNAVLGCPMTGSTSTADFIATADSVGAFTDEYNVEVLTQGNAVGMSYATVSTASGSGVPSISTALGNIGDEWVTMIVNGFGSEETILDALEDFNGDANTKTGRYDATIFKPCVAFFGDNNVSLLTESSEGAGDGITEITDTPTGRKSEMTNVFCPAPNSKGTAAEAAANMCVLYAPLAQSTPNVDPIGLSYPDMPIDSDTDIGDFADVAKRDQIVKIGGSTVKLVSGLYNVVDLVTTYHPDNEPQTAVLFRWVRDVVGVDFNFRYAYKLLEEIYVVGKTIVQPGESSATGTISTNRWKSILASQYGPSLVDNALMADLSYFIESLNVQIGESNPNRFETNFKAKRTGTARVLDTTNQTTFNFG